MIAIVFLRHDYRYLALACSAIQKNDSPCYPFLMPPLNVRLLLAGVATAGPAVYMTATVYTDRIL